MHTHLHLSQLSNCRHNIVCCFRHEPLKVCYNSQNHVMIICGNHKICHASVAIQYTHKKVTAMVVTLAVITKINVTGLLFKLKSSGTSYSIITTMISLGLFSKFLLA